MVAARVVAARVAAARARAVAARARAAEQRLSEIEPEPGFGPGSSAARVVVPEQRHEQ